MPDPNQSIGASKMLYGRFREPLTLRARVGLSIFLALFITGCKVPQDKPDITWHGESRSPDGRWLATATSVWGGVSVASSYDLTTVYLNQAGQQPIKVLVFDHGYPTLPIKMTWTDPNTLHVTVDETVHSEGQHIKLIYKVDNFADVHIAVDDFHTSY